MLRWLSPNALSTFLYDSENDTISSQMKGELRPQERSSTEYCMETTERNMQRTRTFVTKRRMKRTLLLRNKKNQLQFLCHVITEEHLTLTVRI